MNRYPCIFSTYASRFTLGSDGSGQVFIATVAAGRFGRHLRVAPLPQRRGETDSADELALPARGILDVALSHDQAGRLVAVWNQLGPAGVRLKFAVRQGPRRWSSPAEISPLPGGALAPVMARDELGRLWCVFQNNSLGAHHIFVTWMWDGMWAFPRRISDGDGHCFAPAACPFGHGVRVVWDARIDETYGIYMREVDTETKVSRHEPQATVAEADTLLARATILALDGETSLIVYERAQDGWGRPNRSPPLRSRVEMTRGNFLNARRRLHGVTVGPDGIAPLRADLHRQPGWPACPTRTGPQLGRDGTGGIWLAFRQIESIDHLDEARGFVQAVTCYHDGAWQPPAILPDSVGSAGSPAVLARSADGALLAAYAQRDTKRYRMHVVALPPIQDSRWPTTEKFETMEIPDFDDSQAVAKITTDGGHSSPRLLWGDLHRHSDVSTCRWWLDGSPADAYRYALAAAELDFLALTDHNFHLTTPDAQAEVHDLANAYNLPGVFTAFCAYEASLPNGEGHMAVLSDGNSAEVRQGRRRRALLAKLDPSGTVVIPHHTGDPNCRYRWHGHNQALGPVAEIFQPYRTGFEADGAPVPPTPWLADGNAVDAECTLLAAWKMGLKIGVIASSDHLSTSRAYAGVWADGNTRRDILAALRLRRCFAATDKIELAFWADEHFMGECFPLRPKRPDGRAGKVNFKVRCRATAAIRRIELLQDGEVIHTFKPAGGSKALRMTVRKKWPVPPGEHFYTVRVHQADRNMAWGSPIWITA